MKSLQSLFRKTPVTDELPAFIKSLEDLPGVRIARLQGNVGKDIGPYVQQIYEQNVREQEPMERSLIVDFAGTSDADFSTVSYLVQALKARLAKSRKVGVINATPELVGELQISKLDDVLKVYDSEDEAMAELAD